MIYSQLLMQVQIIIQGKNKIDLNKQIIQYFVKDLYISILKLLTLITKKIKH